MDEQQFFNQFSRDLNRDRYFESNTEQWERMEGLLEKSDRRKRRKALLLSALLPTILLLATGFLGFTLYKVNRKADHLQARLEKLEANNPVSVVPDTVFTERTVYKHDTIFVKQKTLGSSIAQLNRFSPEFYLNPHTQLHPYPQNSVQSLAENVQQSYTESEENASEQGPLPQLTHQSQDLNRRSTLPVVEYELSPIESTPKLSFNYLIEKYKPQKFAVGGTVGVLFPTSTESIPLHAYSLGLQGEAMVNDRFRLRMEAVYAPSRVRISANSPNEWSLPNITPPTVNDDLDGVRVTQAIYDFSLGWRYMLDRPDPLRFYVSGAWLSKLKMRQALQYGFYNPMTDEDTRVSFSRDEAVLTMQGMQLGLGSDWKFNNRYSIGMEAIYQHQFSFSERLMGSRWGLRSQLLYHF